MNDCAAQWTETLNGELYLRWSDVRPWDGPVYRVFVNGVLHETTQNRYSALGLLPSPSTVYVVKDSQAYSGEYNQFSITTGNRVRIECPAISLADCPDFYAYRFYYGTSTLELMAENVGTNANIYTTPNLDPGTYQFRVDLVDTAGNVQTGSVSTCVVIGRPPTPSASLHYANGIATITADSSGYNYGLYSNYQHGYGLQPGLLIDPYYRISLPSASGQIQVFPGDWQFALTAINDAGGESEYEILSISIASNMNQLPIVPNVPSHIEAIPAASGTIMVSVWADGGNGIRIYQDGVYVGSADLATDHTDYYTEPLTHGVRYDFQASVINALNGTSESTLTDTVYAIADAIPPSGSTSLTLGYA